MKNILYFSFSLILLMFSCDVTTNKSETSLNITSITFASTSFDITLGQLKMVNVNISPSTIVNLTAVSMSVTSSDETVATISGITYDGGVAVVSIKGLKVGTSKLTFSVKGSDKTATATVNVTPISVSTVNVTAINLNKTTLTLSLNEMQTLTTNVMPKNATDTSITWSSSSDAVATVSSAGVVKGISKGTAVITATSKSTTSVIEKCTVTVISPVTEISLNNSTLTVKKGLPQTLVATITPNNADDLSITWTSSDNAIATVENGKVTGLKEGTVTITATSSNPQKSASCTVTVTLVAELLTFKFEKTKNAGMINDVSLTNFNGNQYGGNFTYIANNQLIPTFTVSTGATVEVNGTVQTSGTTKQDFTSAVIYNVKSSDGLITQTYRVKLNVLNDTLEVNYGSLGCKSQYLIYIQTAILADSMNGSDVSSIRTGAFGNNLPDDRTTTTIDESTTDYPNLKSISLPNSLTYIGSSAFRRCTGITNIVFPNSITNIEASAFIYCSGLKSLNLPNLLNSLGKQAFYGCTGLRGNLVIPNSVTTMGNEVFRGCSGIDGNLTIGTGLTTIPNGTFSSCASLTGINSIPANITTIGNYAFYRCYGLSGNLRIPATVTSIGTSAFEDDNGFTLIEYSRNTAIDATTTFNGITPSKVVTY